MFGWTAAEILGRNVSLLMPSPDREAHDLHLQRYALTGERHIIGIGRRVTAQRKDGSPFPAQLAVGEAASGPHPVFTGFIKDLSQEERARSRLHELQSELVHLSRLSAMGEMATALAHELNQPLTAIANYLSAGRMVLERENPESQADGAMAKAVEQSLRAGEIIRRLRDFVARSESERELEDLSAVVVEAAPLALTGAKEQGITVDIRSDPSVGLVDIDKVQVQQVLVNLVRNGLEAMDGCDTRELVISITKPTPELAQVSVSDTGTGISPEIADQLFQPFVTTKGSQGMGVGLSISRNIIEAQGGRIWAESNPGGGTIFHFTLPRANREEAS